MRRVLQIPPTVAKYESAATNPAQSCSAWDNRYQSNTTTWRKRTANTWWNSGNCAVDIAVDCITCEPLNYSKQIQRIFVMFFQGRDNKQIEMSRIHACNFTKYWCYFLSFYSI